MSLADQIASDFAGIAGDLGTAVTVAGKTLDGVLSEVGGSFALEDGGLGEAITSKFRYNPAAQTGTSEGFIPQAGARVTARGKTLRVVGVTVGGSHSLVTLDLSQQR